MVLASWKDVGGEVNWRTGGDARGPCILEGCGGQVNWHAGGDAHGPCILEGCGGRGKLARRWQCSWSLQYHCS